VIGVLEDNQAREVVSEILGPEDIFGEGGAFHNAPSLQTFRSHGGCEIVHISRTVLLQEIAQSAGATLYVARALARRLQAAHDKASSLALDDVYSRVMAVLIENAHGAESEASVDIGSPMIATLVGASREMVSRVMKDLVTRGMLRRRGRNAFVADAARMREWAARRRERKRD
jgi:CRP/FNR family cyclic AMP-dependent transcriptional regulator